VSRSFTLVDNQDRINALAERLGAEPWVAVDTEFMRERTYYPVLCLLQVGTEKWCELVDPLADVDLDPLWDALYRPSLRKVFHAAEQDLELLTLERGTPPANLFDTQIAAPLLGQPEGMGYARLVEALTGVQLSKDQTRADWAARPLSEAALRYAADDVIHLATIYPMLERELARLGRDAWLEADWASLADAARFQRDPETVGQRLKGLDRLSPAQQARAQRLATWRERIAQQTNQPKGWLLSDGTLQLVARRNPTSLAELKRIRDLKPGVASQHGTALLDVLAAAPSNPEHPIRTQRKSRGDDNRRAVLDALGAHVSLIATQQAIHPDALAPRSLLDRWLDDPSSHFTPAWRDQLLFEPLAEFLSGTSNLRVESGALVVDRDS